MRTINYRSPYKVKRTLIHEGKVIYDKQQIYYSRFSTVITKMGICTVIDFDWQTNNGKIFYTWLETVKDGFIYSATVDEGRLKERQIKWLATHFMNHVHKPPSK